MGNSNNGIHKIPDEIHGVWIHECAGSLFAIRITLKIKADGDICYEYEMGKKRYVLKGRLDGSHVSWFHGLSRDRFVIDELPHNVVDGIAIRVNGLLYVREGANGRVTPFVHSEFH